MKRSRTVAVVLLLAALGAGCRATPAAQAEPDRAFALPGDTRPWGWTRSGAGEREFRCDARRCLDESAEARRAAPEEESARAAFLAFDGCMDGRGWQNAGPEQHASYLKNAPDHSELDGCPP